MTRRPPQYERHSWVPAKKTRKISARLPEQLVVSLNKVARRYQRTREEIIVMAVADWVDDSKYQRIRREIALSVLADRVTRGSQG
jgi:metal-responsive CopG/Arc/MetJ family transcriptional regulator